MIEIDNLKLQYSPFFTLAVRRLVIVKGEILCIIGPNGAGKTSLLNSIALFEDSYSGDIKIGGKDARLYKSRLDLRRRMSFVFAQPYLLNETVYSNICLPLKLRGRRDSAKAAEMLEFFKIGHLKDKNARVLSQGEKHRVSLARAFVSQPQLLLLDEAFLSLDERFKESLIRDLRKIIEREKITVIFATQDQREALSMADTIVVMKNGRILQQGKPQDIFGRPASCEVADFVGVETILEGAVIKTEENLCSIKVGEQVLEAVSDCLKDERVFVCIRPEDVLISRQMHSGSARNHFTAKILDVEAWGLEYKLNLDCGFNLVAAVTRQSLENLDLKTGENVFAAFKATAIHLIRR